MNDNAQIVQTGGQDYDQFGIVGGQLVMNHRARFNAGLNQQALDPQRGVSHNANMHLAVITDTTPVYRVNIGASPELRQFDIRIDAFN
jgi:hypothetical protein